MRHFELWHHCPRWRRRIGRCPFGVFDGDREESEDPEPQATGQEARGVAFESAGALAGAGKALAGKGAMVSIGAASEAEGDVRGVPFDSIYGRTTVPVAALPSAVAEPLPGRRQGLLDQLFSNQSVVDAIAAAVAASVATGGHGAVRRGVSGIKGGTAGLKLFDSAKELSEAFGFSPDRSLRDLASAENIAAALTAAGRVVSPRGQHEGTTAAGLVGGISDQLRDREGMFGIGGNSGGSGGEPGVGTTF